MNLEIQQKINQLAQKFQAEFYDQRVRELGERLAVMESEFDPVLLLIEILLSGDEWAGIEVVELFAELKDERAIPALLKTLDYETYQKPFNTQLEELKQKGDTRGVIAFVEHLGGDVERLREKSSYALGEIGSRDAVDGLIAVLNGEEDSSLKLVVATALKKIGSPEAIEAVDKWEKRS